MITAKASSFETSCKQNFTPHKHEGARVIAAVANAATSTEEDLVLTTAVACASCSNDEKDLDPLDLPLQQRREFVLR